MSQLTIQETFDLAVQYHQAGRLSDAKQLYQQVLAQQPEHAEALHYLGVIAHQAGRIDVALDLIRQAIALNPNSAEAHSDLGIVLTGKGELDDAVAMFRQAIALNPNYAEAFTNLGNVLKDREQFDEAIAAHRRAVSLRPNFLEAHNNLGIALAAKGELDEAMAVYRQAIALRPNSFEAQHNLGTVLKDKGQLAEAVAAYRQAISFNPQFADAHHNLSLALLTCGDFESGWEEYEWRWKWKDFSSPRRNFAQPRWDGGPLEGRTILLHTEQGLGDAIQFIRYVPLVAQRGGKVIVECQAELQRLFQTMSAEFQIVAQSQSLPAFDLHCPLLSLPLVFRTNLTNIPGNVPYLKADPALVDAWSRTLGPHDGRVRVGLAWAGNSNFKGDRKRSLDLRQLAPFAAVRGVQFYSLQKSPAGDVKHPPDGLELVDLGPKLNDFADTAAVISLMDLVVSTDTSVPHLAGALGKLVWVMLQFVPDFRWLLEREESPWYPTMRLFRQSARGDWDGVIASG